MLLYEVCEDFLQSDRAPEVPILALPTTSSPGSSPTIGQAAGAACLLPGHGRHGLPAAADGHHRVWVVPHRELWHGWSSPSLAPSASSGRATQWDEDMC
jgi:hypothetical protein